MKKKYLYTILIASTIAFITLSVSDLGVPNVESIYGGRINAVSGYQIHSDSTRIFIATESANSVFYADMFTTNSGTPSVGLFKVVPSLDNTQDFGSGIKAIEIHEASESLYFTNNNKLYTTTISDATATDTGIAGVSNVLVKADNVFAAGAGQINYGSLDASNTFTPGAGTPLAFPSFTEPFYLSINPTDNKVYVFSKGTSPKLYSSTETYTTFNNGTTFTDISPTLSSTGVTWTAFSVAPDGRYFIGGNNNSSKYIAYSDDNGTTWTEFDTGINGTSGSEIAFSGNATTYFVYFSSIESNNKGVSGSWSNFGATSSYTHPNDGTVFTDPNNSNIVYVTTDQGLGISFDKGLTVESADEGIEAVQVNDMEMTIDKDTAWVASKSGIRKVVDYTTSPSWTTPMFPSGDGSPYFSVGMNPTSSKVAYAGNVRIYKTTDGGSNWSQVFTPEVAPYSYSQVGTQANAITVNPWDENIVMAGFSQKDTAKGGLFISSDAGATWSQQLLFASSGSEDVDVNDIVFSKEGSDTIVYVGVDYDLSAPTGRSIYKLVQSGSSWTVTQDMNGATTSTGSAITVTIKDLTSTHNNIYATGTDAGTNHPVVYFKNVTGANKWTPYTTSGFPSTAGKKGKAVTLGIDTLYCAVDNEVYYLPTGASSWTNGYTYPVGTKINFIYYDDLLVATDTGLYAQAGPSATASVNDYNKEAFLSFYPNPATSGDAVTLNYQLGFDGSIFISIYNLQGKLMHKTEKEQQFSGNNSFQMNIPNLSRGIYFLTLQNGKRKIATKKIIIQ